MASYGLDYRTCTIEELQAFIRTRGIQHSGQAKTRTAIIKFLERADEDATFRFQDMPPEMRNQVYNELLVLPEAGPPEYSPLGEPVRTRSQGCHPQIISTCRGIRDEASSILYGANVTDIRINRVMSTISNNYASHQLTILRLPPTFIYENEAFGELRTQYKEWKPQLLNFQSLRIYISFYTVALYGTPSKHDSKLPHLLFSLVSFLQQSEKLKTVTIIGETKYGSQMVQEAALPGLLYPLARLCANFDCKFKGFVEYPKIAQQIQEIAEDNHELYKMNVLQKAELVRAEGEAYKGLVEINRDEKAHLRQHNKSRATMLKVFDLPFDKGDDERALLEWADQAGRIYEKIFAREVGKTLEKASGFWKEAADAFARSHSERIRVCGE